MSQEPNLGHLPSRRITTSPILNLGGDILIYLLRVSIGVTSRTYQTRRLTALPKNARIKLPELSTPPFRISNIVFSTQSPGKHSLRLIYEFACMQICITLGWFERRRRDRREVASTNENQQGLNTLDDLRTCAS